MLSINEKSRPDYLNVSVIETKRLKKNIPKEGATTCLHAKAWLYSQYSMQGPLQGPEKTCSGCFFWLRPPCWRSPHARSISQIFYFSPPPLANSERQQTPPRGCLPPVTWSDLPIYIRLDHDTKEWVTNLLARFMVSFTPTTTIVDQRCYTDTSDGRSFSNALKTCQGTLEWYNICDILWCKVWFWGKSLRKAKTTLKASKQVPDLIQLLHSQFQDNCKAINLICQRDSTSPMKKKVFGGLRLVS